MIIRKKCRNLNSTYKTCEKLSKECFDGQFDIYCEFIDREMQDCPHFKAKEANNDF